ncbi:ADP-ribosylglycohydrolase family protein [Candidatus Riflebacteria bacterium]
MDDQLQQKLIGCIFGGAIGDVLGSHFENQPAAETASLHDLGLILTDDTQLTLATCESIAEQRAVVPQKIAEKFLSWHKARKITRIGAATAKALKELSMGGHWALVGRKGDYAAGSGAAMRAAPLGFIFNPNNTNDKTIIRDVCRITHHNDEAYVGALAVVCTIYLAINQPQLSGNNTLLEVIKMLPDTRVKDRLILISELHPDTSITQAVKIFGNSGYVVETVPLAFYAFLKGMEMGFIPAIQETVLNGGDADTIASMAGQMHGGWCGVDALPQPFIEKVPGKEDIEAVLLEFLEVVS